MMSMKTLTPVETKIMELLESGKAMTRSEIREACKIESMSNVVDVHIKNIRKKVPVKIYAIRANRFVSEGGYILKKDG